MSFSAKFRSMARACKESLGSSNGRSKTTLPSKRPLPSSRSIMSSILEDNILAYCATACMQCPDWDTFADGCSLAELQCTAKPSSKLFGSAHSDATSGGPCCSTRCMTSTALRATTWSEEMGRSKSRSSTQRPSLASHTSLTILRQSSGRIMSRSLSVAFATHLCRSLFAPSWKDRRTRSRSPLKPLLLLDAAGRAHAGVEPATGWGSPGGGSPLV
mmetsp:Transcript_141596/g.353014  ORF Transcript_141596/g.353014 Transcript_141596/m.353014 type:complete len:216 (+) Transcript_141596:3731-4378(+)